MNHPKSHHLPKSKFFYSLFSYFEPIEKDVNEIYKSNFEFLCFRLSYAHRGVAQLVEFTAGGREAAGSSPVTPTIRRLKISNFRFQVSKEKFELVFLNKIINIVPPIRAGGEMVDTLVLGTSAARLGGSSPLPRTIEKFSVPKGDSNIFQYYLTKDENRL